MYRHLIVETITSIFVKISISISMIIVLAFNTIRKSALLAKNLIVDSLIIRKMSAINSKNVSRIVFHNSRHVQDLIVVWNSTLLIMKTSIIKTIISINTLRNYRLTFSSKTSRLALLWSSSMNILKRLMNRKRNVFWSRSNH
jgi:hypothetical protein